MTNFFFSGTTAQIRPSLHHCWGV